MSIWGSRIFKLLQFKIGYLERDLKFEKLLWSSVKRWGGSILLTEDLTAFQDDRRSIERKKNLLFTSFHSTLFSTIKWSTNYKCSCLKMSTKYCLFSAENSQKRFVVFLRSRLSYRLLIVCKMIVWLTPSFFVKNFCWCNQRYDLGDRKRDSSEMLI